MLEPGGEAAGAVAARWPGVVVGGRIDRSALAAVVFADAAARAELEAITHPAIARLLAAQVAEAAGEVVLVEMPLPIDLLGPGWRWVVVDAPDEVRLARLVARGMEAGDAARRMAAQPSRADWLRAGRPGGGQRGGARPPGRRVPPGVGHHQGLGVTARR